mgnify:FL=1
MLAIAVVIIPVAPLEAEVAAPPRTVAWAPTPEETTEAAGVTVALPAAARKASKLSIDPSQLRQRILREDESSLSGEVDSSDHAGGAVRSGLAEEVCGSRSRVRGRTRMNMMEDVQMGSVEVIARV